MGNEMDFKQLNLDRSRFQDLVDKFFNDKSTKIEKRSETMWEVKRMVDGKNMILQFHYKNDGRTTLVYKSGQHQEKSKELADFIKSETLIDPRHNKDLSFKGFSQVDLNEMVEYLLAVPGIKLTEDKEISSGQRKLRFTGQQKDTVTLVYHSNSTLQLQGRPVTLYCQIIAFLSEYLSLGDIIESQSKFISVPIKQEDIQYELDARMPLANRKIDVITRKMLITSVSFTKINIDLPDYTPFAFPALRALEGHLKSLFFHKGITIRRGDGFSQYFDFNGRRYFLSLTPREKIDCLKTCEAIENSYNYYYGSSP